MVFDIAYSCLQFHLQLLTLTTSLTVAYSSKF